MSLPIMMFDWMEEVILAFCLIGGTGEGQELLSNYIFNYH
jgi:hypothetical protein